jgi:hypothetical protein
MATLALILYGAYLFLAFGLRILIQIRRTGSSGFHGLGGRPGSAEWVAGIGFILALLVGRRPLRARSPRRRGALPPAGAR